MHNLIQFIITSALHLNTSRIENLSLDFLNKTLSAGLLTNHNSFWNDIKYPFPLIIRNLSNSATITHHLTSLIIDLRYENLKEEDLKPFPRNSQTKFVILTTEKNSQNVIKNLIKIGLCKVFVITLNSNGVDSFPLVDQCKGIGILPNFSSECSATLSHMNLPPYVSKKNGKLVGFEGSIVQTLVDNMGLKINFINRNESGYGAFDPPSGLQGDIITKKSILGMGGMYPFEYRNTLADVIMGCGVVNIGWACPSAAGPAIPTWYIILVSEFSLTIWISVLLIYLALIPISMVLNYKTKRNINWPMYNLALMLGIPQKLGNFRSLTICIIISGFLLTCHYSTVMSSKLTVPSPKPEITTQKQLVESGLRLFGPPTAGALVKWSAAEYPEDQVKQKLKKIYEGSITELDVVLPNIVLNRDSACLRQIENIIYRAEKNPITKGKIHIVEDIFDSYNPVTILPKYSCLRDKLQEGYHRLCDSGLVSKWLQDGIERHKENQEKGPRQLALEHIKGFLILLGFGLTLASASFLTELTIFHFPKKMSSKRIR